MLRTVITTLGKLGPWERRRHGDVGGVNWSAPATKMTSGASPLLLRVSASISPRYNRRETTCLSCASIFSPNFTNFHPEINNGNYLFLFMYLILLIPWSQRVLSQYPGPKTKRYRHVNPREVSGPVVGSLQSQCMCPAS